MFKKIESVTHTSLDEAQYVHLKSLKPHERLKVLFAVPEMDGADDIELKKLEMSEEQRQSFERDYRRSKAILSRLEEKDFIETAVKDKKIIALSKAPLIESRARLKFLEQLNQEVKAGEFGKLSPKEQESLNVKMAEAQDVERTILNLGNTPAAQQEFYDILRDPELNPKDRIHELIQVQQKYKLVPQAVTEAQKNQENQRYKQVTEAEQKMVLDKLKVDDKNQDKKIKILGKNSNGDIEILFNESTCALDLQTMQVDWIKININGTEFIQNTPHALGDEAALHKEVSMARVNAIMAYYDLPFDGMERDSFIEILARETGDVMEFNWSDYDPSIENTLMEFLQMFTADASQKTTRQIFEDLDLMDEGNQLNSQRLILVLKEWMESRLILTSGSRHTLKVSLLSGTTPLLMRVSPPD
ncbi:MAG: hypothetical protein UW70_C0091G0003 [Candidatus Peregrinibacteria bacterium GW2011_GWA2_44_7]|nr:MAG: hypothetical protein UW70_C0091G0003 [Candidatus Peregrinibacteria bacterium GW2011_GWA2_44_7]